MKTLSATLALLSAVSVLNDKSKLAAFAMPSASAPEEENPQGLFALTEDNDEDEGHWELIGQEEWEDVTEEDKGTSGDSNQNGRKLGMYDMPHSFMVDCRHSTLYGGGETKDKITVSFYTSTGKYIGKDDNDSYYADSACDWTGTNAAFDSPGGEEWDYVDIESSGNDAYMIDQAWYQYQSNDELRFGRNNAGVWCVSNDKNDKFGSWSCRRKLRFVATTSGSWMKRGKVYGWK